MDHTVLDQSMFWVGALFVFVPLLSGGAVLYFWWRWKKSLPPQEDAPDAEPGHPVS